MRVLQQRDDHRRPSAARAQPNAERNRGQAGARGPSVPLRRAQSHRACGVARVQGSAVAVAALRTVSRRNLLKAGAGLVVGIAYAPLLALAQDTGTPIHLPGSLNANRLLAA